MVNGLPARLKQMRERAGLSQRQAAERLNVSASIISGYETGERTPSVENLLALSNLYKCSVDYLLGKKSVPPSAGIDLSGLTERQIQLLSAFLQSLHTR